jgi:hypothetical protein
MRRLIQVVAIIICGCAQQKPKEAVLKAATADSSGEWEIDDGCHYFLYESNSLISGAVTWEAKWKLPPRAISGFRAGEMIELYYESPHYSEFMSAGNYTTNVRSFSLRGVLKGDNMNGFMEGHSGLFDNFHTNWQAARRISGIVEIPTIHHEAVFDGEKGIDPATGKPWTPIKDLKIDPLTGLPIAPEPIVDQPDEPDIKVASVTGKVTEQNSSWWRWSYIVKLSSKRGIYDRTADIQFLDAEGFVLDSARKYDITIAAGKTNTISGFEMIPPLQASRVKSLRADIK